ncbi:hypothetical protein CSV79_15295 [Sporosarcina sp. P13]|uniref:reverse transcriptase-like protein n=1 Tax=Sporosarcina sp. P13 TaxID=2048263 RepID=UPI000C170AA6|nr:reverse transcriptase-like protein [Sporosarcina sp. P13]PIC62785.1 hypothetical protein CSV79_15295 [Sporosarcina sp. P13]
MHVKITSNNITVYFDGGFYWEQKTAGPGCVIYYDQSRKSYRLRKNASVHGLISANEAEYDALHLCLRELENLGVHRLPVPILGDSLAVINHLNEERPAIEKDLYSWANKIEARMDALGLKPQYELNSRKVNGEAGRLPTQAMAGVDIIATIER